MKLIIVSIPILLLKNSITNNMRRTKTPKLNTKQSYTLNDTTESDSTTSKSVSTKIQKTAIHYINLVPTTIVHLPL